MINYTCPKCGAGLAMVIFIVAALLFSLPTVGLTDEQESPKDREIRHLKATVTLLRAQIAHQREQIESLRKQLRTVRGQSASRPTSQAISSQLPPSKPTDRKPPLTFLKPPLTFMKHFVDPPEIGQIAHVKKVRIFQIQDESNLLAMVPIKYSYTLLTTGSGKTKIRRVDSVKDVLVWISGINTAWMIDDREIELNRQLHIKGTKRYLTQTGVPKTIFFLEPFEAQELRR